MVSSGDIELKSDNIYHEMDIFCLRINIWNVKCANATTFIFDSQADVLVKVSTFWDREYLVPGGIWTPNLRFQVEWSRRLSEPSGHWHMRYRYLCLYSQHLQWQLCTENTIHFRLTNGLFFNISTQGGLESSIPWHIYKTLQKSVQFTLPLNSSLYLFLQWAIIQPLLSNCNLVCVSLWRREDKQTLREVCDF